MSKKARRTFYPQQYITQIAPSERCMCIPDTAGTVFHERRSYVSIEFEQGGALRQAYR